MALLLNVIVIISMVTLLPPITCELCETGVVKPYRICSDQCIQNTTCSCEAAVGSEIQHCRQYCSYFTKVCSSMTCKGGLTCNQYCGKARCNMTCSENQDICRQNCTYPGKCDIIQCSSVKCDQRCANCTMICTSDVEECKQRCLGGSCNMKCAARNCVPDCKTSNSTCGVDTGGRNVNGGEYTNSSSLLIAFMLGAVIICTWEYYCTLKWPSE